MVHLLRKYQQTLLIAVTVLIIVTFIWFWNGSQAGRGGLGGSKKVASIYGRSITDTEIQRDVRRFQIASMLGLNELVQGMAGSAQNQQQAVENFVWNSYVFQHEADTLQVFPTDREVQDELAKVPGFQTDGRFDPVKLTEFVQNRLPSLGFSDSIVDDLLRDQIRVRKISQLIGSTLNVSDAELNNRFVEENQRMEMSVVRLNTSDVEKGIAVGDDEARKIYDQHKDQYRSDEQRQVSYASFELSEAQKALKGKERTDALQKVGNDAWNMAQAVVEKGADFAGLARKAGAQLGESALFTTNEPDPALSKIPELATMAFRLSTDYPSSDVIEGTNGYYILHLEKTVPSRQLTFEEAKAKVVAQIKKERAGQLMQTKANDLHKTLLASLKAGKTFDQAAKDAGVTATTVPPFSLMEASKLDVPDLQYILQSAVTLGDHQLGEFVTTEAGGLIVYMDVREPVNSATAVMGEAVMKDQVLRQKEMGAFLEWLRLHRDTARLQIVQR